MSARAEPAHGTYPFRDHRSLAEAWAEQDADHVSDVPKMVTPRPRPRSLSSFFRSLLP